VRSWAPKGQTPLLQYSFTWKQLSAVAGVSFWNIYFKLVHGAFRAAEIVAFLKALRRHLAPRKLLIVWDRLPAHRSRMARGLPRFYAQLHRAKLTARQTPHSSGEGF